MLFRKRKGVLRRGCAKVLLSIILVLTLLGQFAFALPAIADVNNCTTYTWDTGLGAYYEDEGFEPYSVTCTVLGHNTTQGFEADLPFYISDYSNKLGSTYYYYLAVNYDVPSDGCTWEIDIKVNDYYVASTSSTPFPGVSASASYNTTITTPGSFDGNSVYNEAVTAANNASTAASNAQNAYTAANTAATNASTAATQATNAANNTTYNSQSAAYWAYQADQNSASAVVPTISSVTGVNGATCTTGSSYQANVNISPGSNITYSLNSITGPGGSPTFGSSGNTITISNLTVSGAYTVSFTASYTPSGKTAQGSFMFFKI